MFFLLAWGDSRQKNPLNGKIIYRQLCEKKKWEARHADKVANYKNIITTTTDGQVGAYLVFSP
jgi:hypothetical protein